MSHDISVLLCSEGDATALVESLISFEPLIGSGLSFEIVLICNGNGAEVAEVVNYSLEQFPTVYEAFAEKQSRAKAWNKAVELSTGRRLLFLAENIVPQEHLIAQHIESHQMLEGENVVLVGQIAFAWEFRNRLLPYTLMEYGLYYAFNLLEHGAECPHQFFRVGNVSIDRERYLATGLSFAEDYRFPGLEDSELAYRLAECGFVFIYNADALAFMNRGVTIEEYREQAREESASVVELVSRTPELAEQYFGVFSMVDSTLEIWRQYLKENTSKLEQLVLDIKEFENDFVRIAREEDREKTAALADELANAVQFITHYEQLQAYLHVFETDAQLRRALIAVDED